MQFGVHLPHIGVDPTASNVARMAQTSDALGYESVWVGDHVALPLRIESAYPYAPDHAMPVGRSIHHARSPRRAPGRACLGGLRLVRSDEGSLLE